MDRELSPLEEAMVEQAERHKRGVGMIAHMAPGLAGALIATAMINEIQRANILAEEPVRYTDPIKDAAHADRARIEIDAHQTRMQAAEDKRVRKAEKLRKSNVQHQDKK